MRVHHSDEGSAIRLFERALVELDIPGRGLRERLGRAFEALGPVMTNTSGLTSGERERFYRLLHRASAHIDLDDTDPSDRLYEAPRGWLEETTKELRELVASVLARINPDP